MTKLNLVLESVRDEFLANSLEESDSEVTILKRKHFLNENINFMKKVIIEENVLGTARDRLNNSWAGRKVNSTGANPTNVAMGTGAAVGAAGLAGMVAPEAMGDAIGGLNDAGTTVGNNISNLYDRAGQNLGSVSDKMFGTDFSTPSADDLKDFEAKHGVFYDNGNFYYRNSGMNVGDDRINVLQDADRAAAAKAAAAAAAKK